MAASGFLMLPLLERTAPRILTEEDHEIIHRVHDLCADWADHGLPIDEVRAHCTSWERNVATRATPPSHVMYRPLMRMLDELIETSVTGRAGRCHWTHQGWMVDAELRDAQAEVAYDPDGTLRILFPIRQPWRVKPSESFQGERGEPIYARTAAERDEWTRR